MTEFIYNLWDIILDLSPWLLLGCLIAGGLHVFMPAGFIRKHLGGGGFSSVVKAVAIGVPMPLCSCGVIPAAIGLKKDGASDGAAVGFLISTPQTGVDSILVAAGFLGWPFAIFKVLSAFVTGLIGGVLVNLLVKTPPVEPTPTPAKAESEKPCCCCSKPEPEPEPVASCCSSKPVAVTVDSCCTSDKTSSDHAAKPVFTEMLSFSIKLLKDIYRWLIFGIILAALITTFLPAGKLAEFQWATGLPGMLLMLVIAMPMYICATSSVPLAASLVAAGLPAGAALVLLMAGPATNIATITAIAAVFGKKVTAIYIATVAVMSIILGLSFDWILRNNSETQAACHAHTLPEAVGITAAIIFLGLIGWFVWQDLNRKQIG